MKKQEFIDRYYNPTKEVQEYLKDEGVGTPVRTTHTVVTKLNNILETAKNHIRINDNKVEFEKDSIILLSPCEEIGLELVCQDYLGVYNDREEVESIITDIEDTVKEQMDNYNIVFEGNPRYVMVLTWVFTKVLELKDKYSV